MRLSYYFDDFQNGGNGRGRKEEFEKILKMTQKLNFEKSYEQNVIALEIANRWHQSRGYQEGVGVVVKRIMIRR